MKMHIVFNASSHEKVQLLLNDCLWQGISLNPNILYLLINLILGKIAVSAAIEKAFLQNSLSEKVRDAVRIDVPNNSTNEIFVNTEKSMYRFKSLLSPFLLAATIKEHVRKFKDEYPDACKILDNCLYVDDLLSSVDNIEEAFKIPLETIQIMSQASFNLRK